VITIVRLGLALAVAVITAATVVSGRFEPAVVTLVSLSTAASIVGLAVSLWNRRRLSAIVDRIRTAAPVVANDPIAFPPPRDIGAAIATVRGLGFELAGATDIALDDNLIRTWILVEPSGDAWTEVGMGVTPMAIFVSDGGGGRFVETAYPMGEPIDDPRLLSQAVGRSEAAALTAHRAAVAAEGGVRRQVRTMDEYIAVEAEHRDRTGGMRIRSHLERVVRPSIRDWSISLVVDVVALAALLASVAAQRGP
jgi:hypothetical protein